jgi:hypothetical protein
MNIGTLARITCLSAADVCYQYELGEHVCTLFQEDLAPRPFLEKLLEHEYYGDAVWFLAHGLPKREAVWWGCLCLGQAANLGPTSTVPAALEAAVRWVVQPSEENRRAAKAPGEAAKLTTPQGCLAKAAFWSGGSMNPPNLPDVLPPPFVTARVVGGGIMLAAVQGDPSRVVERLRQFLALGIGVANGKYLWESPPTPPGVVSAPATETGAAISPEPPAMSFPKGSRGANSRRSE